jgi:hypothetical protein
MKKLIVKAKLGEALLVKLNGAKKGHLRFASSGFNFINFLRTAFTPTVLRQ